MGRAVRRAHTHADWAYGLGLERHVQSRWTHTGKWELGRYHPSMGRKVRRAHTHADWAYGLGLWSVTFSPDGRHTRKWEFGRYHPSMGRKVRRAHTHADWAYGLGYGASRSVPMDGTLASGSFDDTIRLWDARSGAPIRTLTGHTDVVE